MRPILLFASLVLAAGAAAAQPADGGRPGGFTPTPEMRAAREAGRQACAADAKTLCADNQQGRGVMRCLRSNAEKLSQPCKDALAKMPAPPPRPQN